MIWFIKDQLCLFALNCKDEFDSLTYNILFENKEKKTDPRANSIAIIIESYKIC
jgi:hypothetical protein